MVAEVVYIYNDLSAPKKLQLDTYLSDSSFLLQVMHDCRWISDCLFHQYGVLLFNVFDTQVPFRYSGWEQMFKQEKLQPCSGHSLREGLTLLECDSC